MAASSGASQKTASLKAASLSHDVNGTGEVALQKGRRKICLLSKT